MLTSSAHILRQVRVSVGDFKNTQNRWEDGSQGSAHLQTLSRQTTAKLLRKLPAELGAFG